MIHRLDRRRAVRNEHSRAYYRASTIRRVARSLCVDESWSGAHSGGVMERCFSTDRFSSMTIKCNCLR